MESMKQAQRAIAKALGFGEQHTGGGCMAYQRNFAGGVHVMVTNADFDLPDGTDWYVGVYDANAEHLGAHWYGEAIGDYISAINDAIAFADKSIPSTDKLSDEFAEWTIAQGLPNECAESLLLRIAMQKAWLEDFATRWEQVQAHEDFRQACATRGE